MYQNFSNQIIKTSVLLKDYCCKTLFLSVKKHFSDVRTCKTSGNPFSKSCWKSEPL